MLLAVLVGSCQKAAAPSPAKSGPASSAAKSGPATTQEPSGSGEVASESAPKVLFDQHCAQCHGEKGDGNGPAARFLYPKPRS
jgi:mono/diheme cytochrome c family protein